MGFTYEDVAKSIDHSLLSPSLTTRELESGCQLALSYEVASVCIMPFYLERAQRFFEAVPYSPVPRSDFHMAVT